MENLGNFKCRTLRKEEIELRVGQFNKDKSRATLLLYKNARVDMALLDERFGAENWECDYKELKGNLYCGVGVRYQANADYVWKWDCGTESKTEAEKGEASDAFKRACVRHGQGRELYTAPTIWVDVPKDGSIYRDTFTITELGYNEAREISTLTIVETKTGKVVFNMGNKPVAAASSTKPTKDTTAPVQPVKRTVTMEHYTKGQCKNLIAELAHYDCNNLPEWEAGKQSIRYRKNADGVTTQELTIETEVMEKIEADAIAIRQAARLGNAINNAATEMISK